MKNTFKLFGIIAVIAVISFSMAGCDNESPATGGGVYTPTSGLYRVTGQAIVAADRVELNLGLANLVTSTALHVNENPGTFILLVGHNVIVSPATANFEEGVHLTVVGIGGRRNITRQGAGTLFTVNGPNRSLTLGDNIDLVGNAGNTLPLVSVQDGGVLTMNYGARIRDNTVTAINQSGGVHVTGAGSTFTMNGGEIFENRATNIGSAAGVRVHDGASFVMHEGAVIRDNTATGGTSGSGVRVGDGASFVMQAGVIRDNTAEGINSGAGVSLYNDDSTFTMLGGEIRRNEATSNTSTAGGVRVSAGTFRIVNGVIYGAGAGAANANIGGTLLLSAEGTATPCTMVGGVFTPSGSPLDNTGTTIRVVDGVRQAN